MIMTGMKRKNCGPVDVEGGSRDLDPIKGCHDIYLDPQGEKVSRAFLILSVPGIQVVRLAW